MKDHGVTGWVPSHLTKMCIRTRPSCHIVSFDVSLMEQKRGARLQYGHPRKHRATKVIVACLFRNSQ